MMPTPRRGRGLRRLQRLQQLLERPLELVVILPVLETRDVIRPHFRREILAEIGVEELPSFQRLVIHQRDGKQFAALLLLLGLARAFELTDAAVVTEGDNRAGSEKLLGRMHGVCIERRVVAEGSCGHGAVVAEADTRAGFEKRL